MLIPARVSTRMDSGLASGGGTGTAGRSPATGGTTAWASAAVEFALTGGVLFVVVSTVRWVMTSPRSRVFPEAHLQLAAVAVIVGAVLAWALSSPWGRYSGGHLNPAVTVGLWLTGAFHGRRVLPYVAAQLAGSVVGTGLARLVWGPVVGGRMVYAALKPDPAWPAAAVFAAEAAATAVTLTVTLVLMSRLTWRRWIPLARSTAVAVVMVVLGTMTGGSANPARQFGPALWAHHRVYWSPLWIYLVAPLAGAALTAGVARYQSHRLGHSSKLARAQTHGRPWESAPYADGRTC
jgi:glycerol uptake facilitator-like aquaporin